MLNLDNLPPVAAFGAMRTIAIPGGSAPFPSTRDKFVALSTVGPEASPESPPDADQPGDDVTAAE